MDFESESDHDYTFKIGRADAQSDVLTRLIYEVESNASSTDKIRREYDIFAHRSRV